MEPVKLTRDTYGVGLWNTVDMSKPWCNLNTMYNPMWTEMDRIRDPVRQFLVLTIGSEY